MKDINSEKENLKINSKAFAVFLFLSLTYIFILLILYLIMKSNMHIAPHLYLIYLISYPFIGYLLGTLTEILSDDKQTEESMGGFFACHWLIISPLFYFPCVIMYAYEIMKNLYNIFIKQTNDINEIGKY